MVVTIIFLIAWEGIKLYWWIVAWILRAWVIVAWKLHCWYVKGMAYVLDSSPRSPQIRSPNGNKRRAIEMEEQSPESSSREQPAATTVALCGRPGEATVPEGYVAASFKLAAFSACFEAVENLRRRDALFGVHDEELIQMLTAIIRGGRDLYSVRIPWPVLEGGEGGGRINGVSGVNGSHRPVTPLETTDWESIYNKYKQKSAGEGGEGAGTSDASKPRAKSPEYVDNLNKIHNSLASLHAIVEKTNAEKEELKKIQSSASASSSSVVSPREEKEGRKEEERSPKEKNYEKEKIEKKKEDKEKKEDSKKTDLFDDLFDDSEDDDGRVPPAAKRRKEETRDEKKKRKEEERKKKRGGEDEHESDGDDEEKKEREKEKRREEREREKRQAIMAISGCYTVKSSEQEEREKERERAKERERERAKREAREEQERERLKEKALEKERLREEEERRKKEEEKSRDRSASSPQVMPVRKSMKKCSCTLPFPDLSEFNEKTGTVYKTLEETGVNWNDLKTHTIVATLRNGRWVRARVNECRSDGLYLGQESGGGGFSGRVKESTGCIHINKIVAIEKK